LICRLLGIRQMGAFNASWEIILFRGAGAGAGAAARQFVFVMWYEMPNKFGFRLSSRPRFRRGAVYALVLCGLAAASVAVLPAATRAAKATPAPGKSFRDCSNGCPEMVVVPKGSFMMGVPAGEEPESLPDSFRGHSVPQHLVTIGYKFAIGKFDVTRDEYAQFVAETHRPDDDRCMTAGFVLTGGNQHSQGIPQTTGGPAVCGTCITVGASGNDFVTTNGNWHFPGFPQTGRDPVVCVSWDDAKAYVSWLSAKTRHAYHLPTEAEWEYAARAGTTTARYFSDNPAEFCRYSNIADVEYRRQYPRASGTFGACSDGYLFTSPVGRFPPNQFGLYDMLGDVMDWTEDCWNADYNGAPADGTAWLTGKCSGRVVHGGSWDADLRVVRSAQRRSIPTFYRVTTFGFRVARTL
jgi:formylglycine-generating enzyme